MSVHIIHPIIDTMLINNRRSHCKVVSPLPLLKGMFPSNFTNPEARNFRRSVKTGVRMRSKKSKKKKLLLFINMIKRVINIKQNLNRMGFWGILQSAVSG